jgi:hypothetical protein
VFDEILIGDFKERALHRCNCRGRPRKSIASMATGISAMARSDFIALIVANTSAAPDVYSVDGISAAGREP